MLQDEHIDRFLHLINAAQEQKIPPRMTEVHFENELKRSIMDVVKAKGENLIHFLPLILDKLIMLMARPPVIGGNICRCFAYRLCDNVNNILIILDNLSPVIVFISSKHGFILLYVNIPDGVGCGS